MSRETLPSPHGLLPVRQAAEVEQFVTEKRFDSCICRKLFILLPIRRHKKFVLSTLTKLADVCMMASVLLHGLPLLHPGRVWFKSVGYLPESHPAVIGRGWEIKAKGGRGGGSIKS